MVKVIKVKNYLKLDEEITVDGRELIVKEVRYLRFNSGSDLTETNQFFLSLKMRLDLVSAYCDIQNGLLFGVGKAKDLKSGNLLTGVDVNNVLGYLETFGNVELNREKTSKTCPLNSKTIGKYLLSTKPKSDPDGYIYEIPIHLCELRWLVGDEDDTYITITPNMVWRDKKLVTQSHDLWFEDVDKVRKMSFEEPLVIDPLKPLKL